MFRLDRIDKAYREAGVVLEVRGVDYECLESSTIDNLTKRLESAFRIFDEKCRVYEYLFKANGEQIPYQIYGSRVVDAAIENRIAFLSSKADALYSLKIYFAILFEGFRYKQALVSSLAKLGSEPHAAWREIKAYLSRRNQVILIDVEIVRARAASLGKARNFILQISDFCSIEILGKEDTFGVPKRILNFDPRKLETARLKHDAFLDWHLSESHLECHRGYLRLDDYFLKVLTLKEPSAQTFPLIFKRLLEVEANYYVVTEWKKQPPDKSRSLIHSRRRHFHNTKRSLMSHLTFSDHRERTDDILIDDSKEAQVRYLGLALKELEINGNYFGEFSLTVVIYDLDLAKVERAGSDFYKVFSVSDAELYEERYNLLNAYLATVPGNYAFNLRKMQILNTNYADYSVLFTLHCGDTRNQHLQAEYLAVLETNHKTPYYLNPLRTVSGSPLPQP